MKKENLKLKKRCELMNEEIKELQEAIDSGIEIASMFILNLYKQFLEKGRG